MATDGTHTHAKAGGGSVNHSHPGATKGHQHDKGAKDGDAKSALLPLPAAIKGANADDVATVAAGMSMGESDTALFALEFEEKAVFAEGRALPFLKVGSWDFPDYGRLEVTPEHLKVVKRFFDEDARRQDLPVINEAHDSHRAVGWIKDLVWNGDGELNAVPDYNAVGEQVVHNDEYRYVSPELLRNWTDPETGTTYPLIAAGLALTNYPRMKALGRIAASEANPGCALIACSEKPMGTTPMEARNLLMAENDPDGNGDDDGALPLCYVQAPHGGCPGYTRRPGDTDGDGTCLFADKGCNGYRPIDAPVGNTTGTATITTYFGESRKNKGTSHMPDQEPTPEKPAVQPDEGAKDLLMAEQKRNQDLSDRVEASEKRNSELEQRINAMERERTVNGIRAQFAELVREGKVTPAEVEKFCPDDDHAVKLSENSFVLDALRERKPVITFGEKGSAGDEGTDNAHQRLLAMAEEIRKGDPKVTPEQAYAQAMQSNPELYAEARNQKPTPARV